DIRLADDLDFALGNSAFKTEIIYLAISMNIDIEMFRQSIDNRCTDTVYATGNFITTTAEFPAGVQNRHNYFQCRTACFLLLIDRNAAAIVFDGDAVILFNDHLNMVTKPC